MCDDSEEKVVQGSSFDELTEAEELSRHESNAGINVWTERGVAFYGQQGANKVSFTACHSGKL